MFGYTAKMLLPVVAIVGLVGSAQGQLMSPVDAEASAWRLIGFDKNDPASSGSPVKTINGTGFPGDVVEVATDPDDQNVTVWYIQSGPGGGNAGVVPPQQLYYDLGASMDLQSVVLWNHNDRSRGGVEQIDVGFTADTPASFTVADLAGLTWTDQIVDQAVATDIGTGQTFPFFAPVATRYLRVNVDSANLGAVEGEYGFNEFAVITGFAGPPPADFTWDVSGAGDWNEAANWTTNGPPGNPTNPSFANHTATFGDKITQTRTVFSDTGVSVRAITFDNSNRYIVAGGGHVSLVQGTGEGKTGNSSITVAQGTHQFQLNVELENEADVDVASDASVTFNNALNLNGNTLTKTGGGMLAINNAISTGGGTVNLVEGTMVGLGTIGGNVDNEGGTISPGNSLAATAVPEPGCVMLIIVACLTAIATRSVPRVRPRL